MTKYETGRWYNWDGKSECPFDKSTTDYWIACYDSSKNHFYEKGLAGPSAGINTYHKSEDNGQWRHSYGHANVIAFYIVSYNEPKEMTVQQVEKALGYPVKIVK